MASTDLSPMTVPPNLYEGKPNLMCWPSLKIKSFGPRRPDMKLLAPIFPVIS